MIPRSIVARPDDLVAKPEPDILPLPGAPRRPEREPSAPRPAAAPPQPEVGPRDILNALRYHSVLFVTLGGLLAGGLATAAWFLVPAKYTTYAMVLVGQKETPVVPRPGDDGGRTEFGVYIKTQANIIKSTATMIGAMRDPKAGIAQLAMLRREDDPVSFLEDKVLTEFSDSSEILKVMLTGDDPVAITKIVNAVVDCYMREYKVQREWKHQRIQMLEKNKREIQEDLAKKLRRFDDEFGPPPGSESAQTKKGLRLNQYAALLGRKSELKSQLLRAREVVKDAQERLTQFDANPVPMPDLTQRMEGDQAIALKTFALRRLQKNLDDYVRLSSNPRGPKYYEISRQIEAAAAELEAQKRQFRAAAEADIRTAQRVQYQNFVEKAQFELRQFEATDRATDEELATFTDLDKETAEKKAAEKVE
jgi:polysaccharide biosynthesis transport protein